MPCKADKSVPTEIAGILLKAINENQIKLGRNWFHRMDRGHHVHDHN